jgi:inositol oxygenase
MGWMLYLLVAVCTADEWEDFVEERYESGEEYRVYDDRAPERVKALYRENHRNQTLEFVLGKKAEYLPLRRGQFGIWEAFQKLESVLDQSDPDLELDQRHHAFQTAEAIRRDGHPRWLVLVGLIHDLGKMLESYGEPQWAVVGDTFPVGCAFAEELVFPEYFEENPDSWDRVLSRELGIYEEGCGLDAVHFSWGHDEYMYQVAKDYVPEEAAYIIRYHSFYAGHREGAYQHLFSDYDREMMEWVSLFSQYDLYSKEPLEVDQGTLLPYYEELVAEYFPSEIDW